MRALRWAKTQAYFVGIRAINALHGLLPFFARPLLYRLCGYQVHHSSTVQGRVRFFHVGKLSIGSNTVINQGTYLDNRAGIAIGSGVSIAHDVRIYSLGHEIHDDLFTTKGRPVVIGDGVVIFAGAMIMPGVTLGDGCVVMAGAVVTSNVPKLQIVGGNPARLLGQRDSCPVYLLKRRFWFAH
jgi:acetyltransferase-like isoleucine patch superfamily enzyme